MSLARAKTAAAAVVAAALAASAGVAVAAAAAVVVETNIAIAINRLRDSNLTEKKRPPRNWEGVADKAIREAMERGDFQNLPGQGKPLDLGENPFTPRDWRLAYKVLQDAGVAPEWIEQDKEIRAELQALAALLERQAHYQRERAAHTGRLAPDRIIAEHNRLADVREKTCLLFREKASALNKQIDTLNLKMPISRLHHPRIRIEQEIERFLEACHYSSKK